MKVKFLFSLFFLCSGIFCEAQLQPADSQIVQQPLQKNTYQKLLDSNFVVNASATPQAFKSTIKTRSTHHTIFYVLLILLLLFGIIRSIFSKYFNTLLQVFFNTSLKQNQLTDQLEQAKLPSLLFNAFFVIITGFYLYFLALFFAGKNDKINWIILSTFISMVLLCYAIKYISLLFFGWITNTLEETKAYLFIVFLLNKTLGIFLIPIIIFMIFGSNIAIYISIIASFIFIAILFLLRFFRTFSLLQYKVSISSFHFGLYIFGLELLPLVIVYKVLMIYLGRIV